MLAAGSSQRDGGGRIVGGRGVREREREERL
jgi:hypothetical protein